MSSRPPSSLLPACGFWLGTATLPAPAAAASGPDDVLETGASAAERGQQAHVAGKLLQAREEFRTCSAAVCPGIVLEDCRRWLAEPEAQLPRLTLRARDARDRD